MKKLKYQQWKSINAVIKWFKDINNKDSSKFIQMDIKDFYPSITEETLDAAIIFAQMNTSISNGDIQIIKHSKKYLVFHNTNSCLDVTIGSHDGVEVGEFVGTFILSHPTK